MTTIIGLAHEGKVYLGGDGQTTSGWEAIYSAHPKVFTSGLFVIGASGTVRFKNLTQHHFDIPTDAEDKYDMRYMVRVFIPALREALKEHGAMGKISEKDNSDCLLLVGVRGVLYYIGIDFDVTAIASGLHSIGTGSEYAIGAMTAIYSLSPRERIERSLEIAARYDIGTSAPFTIVEV